MPYCFYHAKSFTTHLEVNLLCSKRLLRCLLCLVFSSIGRLRWIKLTGQHIRERTQSSSLQKFFTQGQDERRESQAEQESHITLWWNLRQMAPGWAQHHAECGTASEISSGYHCYWFQMPLKTWGHSGIGQKYFDSLVFAIVFFQQ